MTENVLETVWACFDTPEPMFTAEVTAAWPRLAFNQLIEAGILRRGVTLDSVVCPNCDEGHVEPVMPRSNGNDRVEYFIRCPESLRVPIPSELLQTWTIDFDGVARAVAKPMSLKGKLRALVRGRLWSLGRTDWKGTKREVMLARGLNDPDGASIAARIGPTARPIVLVAHTCPDERIWPGVAPPVVPLSRNVDWSDGGLELDTGLMFRLVEEADDVAERVSVLPITPDKRKLIVRQQLKSELKSHLTDDVLVAAYKEHQSFRKAAAALSEQMETNITKDRVVAAVKRLGGAAAVIAAGDSGSVGRTVASQSRDRAKKVSQYRN